MDALSVNSFRGVRCIHAVVVVAHGFAAYPREHVARAKLLARTLWLRRFSTLSSKQLHFCRQENTKEHRLNDSRVFAPQPLSPLQTLNDLIFITRTRRKDDATGLQDNGKAATALQPQRRQYHHHGQRGRIKQRGQDDIYLRRDLLPRSPAAGGAGEKSALPPVREPLR